MPFSMHVIVHTTTITITTKKTLLQVPSFKILAAALESEYHSNISTVTGVALETGAVVVVVVADGNVAFGYMLRRQSLSQPKITFWRIMMHGDRMLRNKV